MVARGQSAFCSTVTAKTKHDALPERVVKLLAQWACWPVLNLRRQLKRAPIQPAFFEVSALVTLWQILDQIGISIDALDNVECLVINEQAMEWIVETLLFQNSREWIRHHCGKVFVVGVHKRERKRLAFEISLWRGINLDTLIDGLGCFATALNITDSLAMTANPVNLFRACRCHESVRS